MTPVANNTQPNAVPSRIDVFLAAIAQLVGAAIVANNILPPLSQRFAQGWPIVFGYPDADGFESIRYATNDGGYVVAIDAVEPNRPSNQRWLAPPVITLTDGTTHQETARRLQRVQIITWAATAALRNAIADAIVAALGTDVAVGQWITLPDGTRVRMQYVSGPRRVDEMIANAQAKRADVMIDVDYGTLGPAIAYEPIAQAEGVVTFSTSSQTVLNP